MDRLQPIHRAKMRHHGGLSMQLAKRYEYDYHNQVVGASSGGGGGACSSAAGGVNGATNPTPPPPPPPPPAAAAVGDYATRRRRRDQSFPEYCAPFGTNLIAWGIADEVDPTNVLGCNTSTSTGNKNVNDSRKRRCKYYGLAKDEADEELVVPSVCRDVQPSPADHGNCLLVLPCCCRSCRSLRQHTFRGCWFVVHPTGERLDALSASRITLPRQNVDKDVICSNSGGSSNAVFLGERVLQVAICGANKRWGQDCNGRRLLLVRTRSRCIVVACTWVDSGANVRDGDHNCCSGGIYVLEKVTEIDFFASENGNFAQTPIPPVHADIQSFVPIHLAPNPNATGTNSSAPATFAVLSHSKPSPPLTEQGIVPTSADPQQNMIHYAVVSDVWKTSSVKQYTIPSLRHISHVECTRCHPMVLWASARSSITHKPAIHHKIITSGHRRPTSGRGSNLHTIDLRSCKPALVFNPSHSERMVDGLHSISSILPDCTQTHRVYVESISAGSKVWEIDDRMPGRSVCSWTLPGLCDDWGLTGRQSGLYGWGSILAQPVVIDMNNTQTQTIQDQRQYLPLLGVSKSFGVGRFGMYQRPEVYPRFSTQALECSSFDMNSGNAGFALSSTFALADVSESVFNCGLAAFQVNVYSLLRKEDVQDMYGNETDVRNALCVLSMTNRGDLYGHALIGNTSGQRAGRLFDGLPIGCCAVPVPIRAASSTGGNARQNDIVWNLQNSFPTPSSAILPQVITPRDDERAFYEFHRRYIPSNVDKREPPKGKLSRKKKAKEIEVRDDNGKEIIPQTLYELDKSKKKKRTDVKSDGKSTSESSSMAPVITTTNTTIQYCCDKGGAVSHSVGVGSFVSVKPDGADNLKRQGIAVDPKHASVILDDEKTCKVAAAKNSQTHLQNDTSDEEDTDQDQSMDLTSSSFHKFQRQWKSCAGAARDSRCSSG